MRPAPSPGPKAFGARQRTPKNGAFEPAAKIASKASIQLREKSWPSSTTTASKVEPIRSMASKSTSGASAAHKFASETLGTETPADLAVAIQRE